ncbi:MULTISPECIES: OmpA family protein [Pseudomonadaceae]|uniref:OmpA family protein n=1 Tax=Pseudomonas denitrificans TaxID=43306 RepID=A0A9X7MY10_PSEDE|nr:MULTISPECIES: OmpA family protein [Pseudomonadaceae]MBD9629265.1 OmpA family protein [Pseudomonas sp. PDM19]QEY71414.1 OmpA family protein [Pseudomonas denitrificans (nom. rej.)]
MFEQFKLGGLKLALAASALTALAACGTVSDVDSAGHTQQPVFPAMDDASLPEGSYVNLENLGKMRPGMTKHQVQDLLGHPQFSEGMFGVREWDYIFKFRQAEGQPDKVCQYKVLYDKDHIAQSFYFLPADCQQAAPAPVPAPSPAPQPRARTLNLEADASFAFGSAVLRPEGKAKLDELAEGLKSAEVTSVEIVGYTDRIGSVQNNIRLSQARANAVRSYLMQHGISGALISAEGRGPAQPLVNCPGASTPEVIACLAPNRRTSVAVQAN